MKYSKKCKEPLRKLLQRLANTGLIEHVFMDLRRARKDIHIKCPKGLIVRSCYILSNGKNMIHWDDEE